MNPIRAQVSALRLDLGALALLTIVATSMMTKQRIISRVEGTLLVGAYGAFLVALAWV